MHRRVYRLAAVHCVTAARAAAVAVPDVALTQSGHPELCVYVAVVIIMISWMDEMLVRLSDEVVAMRGSNARVLRRCGSGSCEMDPMCSEGECWSSDGSPQVEWAV